jgi:thiamine pyrophosphokinase
MNIYLIVSGGTVSKELFETVLLEYSFDKIIACDKGLEACNDMNLMPDVIIGDFDSADINIVEQYRDKTEFIQLDVHKDYTDTHVAVNYAVEAGCDRLVLLGATGTRLDHTWANVGLLKICVDNNIEGFIIDEHNRITMINKKYTLNKAEKYDYVSLIPYSEYVSAVTLTGFEYPTEEFTFRLGESIGVSNVITDDSATIHLKSGYLIVIESHD